MTELKAPEPISWVQAIAPYVPGRATTADGRKVIKLSANENPLGTSEKARAAFAAAAAQLPDDLAVATEEVRQMLAFSLDTHGAESPPRKRLREEPAPPDPAAGDEPQRWRPKGRNRGPSKPLPRL